MKELDGDLCWVEGTIVIECIPEAHAHLQQLLPSLCPALPPYAVKLRGNRMQTIKLHAQESGLCSMEAMGHQGRSEESQAVLVDLLASNEVPSSFWSGTERCEAISR